MQPTPMWGAGNLRDAEPPQSDGKDPRKSPAAFRIAAVLASWQKRAHGID